MDTFWKPWEISFCFRLKMTFLGKVENRVFKLKFGTCTMLNSMLMFGFSVFTLLSIVLSKMEILTSSLFSWARFYQLPFIKNNEICWPVSFHLPFSVSILTEKILLKTTWLNFLSKEMTYLLAFMKYFGNARINCYGSHSEYINKNCQNIQDFKFILLLPEILFEHIQVQII